MMIVIDEIDEVSDDVISGDDVMMMMLGFGFSTNNYSEILIVILILIEIPFVL